jgi:hypothetical protein
MDIQNRKDRGESPEEARRAAMREFGNVPLIEDVTRETWGWIWLERLGQDLKYAFRQLRRSPVFTATVIATLTLGLGATAAMFTVVVMSCCAPCLTRIRINWSRSTKQAKKG